MTNNCDPEMVTELKCRATDSAVLEKDRSAYAPFFLLYTVQKSARAETAITRGKMEFF